jgi:SAM-dependent methyltransferase
VTLQTLGKTRSRPRGKYTNSLREYDLIAEWYAAGRTDQTGVPEVTTLVQSLPPGARVLDVGCGNGIPLTRLLRQLGCEVLGVDSSEKMLDRFRMNCPGVPAIHATIQSCQLEAGSFDGAVAWGVLFHLPHKDQAAAIDVVAGALKPDGLFLFTAGDSGGEDGWIDGEPMNGVPFRYYSFDIEGYRRVLRERGLVLEDVHKDAGDNTYYLARRGEG